MRLLADAHISRRTVQHLQQMGHDVVHVGEQLPARADDRTIVETARETQRAILTQDLDFCAIVALSGQRRPSVISLRLRSSRVEHVNAVLSKVLPAVEADVETGCLLTVDDDAIRRRPLPLTLAD
jgi:predicted nuclease of predicted toxin-antitoxin system